ASAPTENRGGTNPQQVGLGMKIGGIDVLHTQGSLQATDRNTDFAIQGSGFFIMRDGSRTFYTRDGAFDVAVTGELVNPTNGYNVQGWRADTNGVTDIDAPLGSINIPLGQSIAAQESTLVTIQGNLDSNTVAADGFSTTIDVYDSLGAPHPVTITYTATANPNEWTVTATSADPAITSITVDTGAGGATVTFDSTGRRTAPALGLPIELDFDMSVASGATDFTMEIDHDAVT